jgi:hypothetical protein
MSGESSSLQAIATDEKKKWSGRRDLNPRLPPRQGGALPLSYARSFSAFVIIARCKPIVESNRRCSEREGEVPAEPNLIGKS